MRYTWTCHFIGGHIHTRILITKELLAAEVNGQASYFLGMASPEIYPFYDRNVTITFKS